MVYRSLRHERGNPDTDDSWNRRVSMPNNPCEAYTANQIGHRGRPHSPEVWYSFDTKFHADDDVVNDTEVNTKDSSLVRIRRVCRSPQGVACLKRSTQELGRPFMLLRTKRVAGTVLQESKGCRMVRRESDSLIVLRARESRAHGEGVSNVT